MSVETLERPEVQLDKDEVVVILDAGAQYGGLIDREVREWGFRTEFIDFETPAEEIAALNARAIIFSGSKHSNYAPDAPHVDPAVFDLGLPILGICYGQHEIARHYDGDVRHTSEHGGATVRREDGVVTLAINSTSPLFDGLTGEPQEVQMTHGDVVPIAPEGFDEYAISEGSVAAFGSDELQVYGLQFHPEAFGTKRGKQIFDNFLGKVAGLEPNYGEIDHLEEAIETFRKYPEGKHFVVQISGGVDSAVALAVLEASGVPHENITAVHFDNGFMRRGESAEVIEAFAERGITVEVVHAQEDFYHATTTIGGVETPQLKDVIDPETKRKIIGDTFFRLTDKYILEHGLPEDAVIVMGSLRTDAIESGHHLASGRADNVVSHHNFSPLTEEKRQKGEVAEPLKHLFKDQVRQLGRSLGLPEHVIDRHPSPGPSLAIRILGYTAVAGPKMDVATRHELQALLREFIDAQELNHDDDQGLRIRALPIPIRSRGVRGDEKAEGWVAGLETRGNVSWSEVARLARKIPNVIPEFIRGVRLFVPNGVEGRVFRNTNTQLLPEEISLLQHGDFVATNELRQSGEYSNISQLPVILTSAGLRPGGRSIILRPFISPDFMTGIAAVPGEHVNVLTASRMIKAVARVAGIDMVMWDLTDKPPGRTEYE